MGMIGITLWLLNIALENLDVLMGKSINGISEGLKTTNQG